MVGVPIPDDVVQDPLELVCRRGLEILAKEALKCHKECLKSSMGKSSGGQNADTNANNEGWTHNNSVIN